MRPVHLIIAGLAGISTAAPTKSADRKDIYSWSAPLARFYQEVDKTIQEAKDSPNFPEPPKCDMSKVELPTAPDPLPKPDASTYLRHIAIGRGVQNYTCENATSKPSAVGAVASLYNVSFAQCNFPDLATMMTNLVINYPLPSDPESSFEPTNILFSGHHYFNEKTPVFNLDVSASSQYGIAMVEKDEATPAPDDAPKGLEGESAVAWLKLDTIDGSTDGLKHVYRVNTVGGSPPETCEGVDPDDVLSVQYAAQYWFYADKKDK